MRTRICAMLGCEVPIFAFSHCRDVVVEVTKAGGFGVLGASTFSPAQLEAELRWIDDHVSGRAYGIDVVVPTTYDAAAEHEAGDLDRLIPAARTGKPVRMIKSKLSEAWEQPGAPAYLPTPLPGVLYNEAHARVVRARRKDLFSFPVGQSVGDVNSETTVRDVMYRLQGEYLEAIERLTSIQSEG